MRTLILAAFAASAFFASASIGFTANGNIVTNGNFNSGLSDWTVTGGNVTSQTSADYDAPGVGGTGDTGTGIFAAFGAGDTTSGVLSQLLSTVAGQLYTVSFNFGVFGAQGGNPQTLTVKAGSATSVIDVGTGQLTRAMNFVLSSGNSFTFTASSTSTWLSFAVSGETGSADLLLDNVKVVGPMQVPGPEAGAGLGALALGGMALWAKRRRRPGVPA